MTTNDSIKYRDGHFHFRCKIHSRSDGADVAKLMAYRAGTSMVSSVTGRRHTYHQKKEVAYSAIALPNLAPERWKSRSILARDIEASEVRKDSQLVREIEVAAPRQLQFAQVISLLHEWIENEFSSKGITVSFDIHNKPASGEIVDPDSTKQVTHGNVHAHLLLCMRSVDSNGFGPKVRAWNEHSMATRWRQSWANACNLALEDAGSDVRVDSRSYKDRGIPLVPTIHLGRRLSHSTDEVWMSKKIQNDLILAARSTYSDSDGNGGDGEGEGDGDGTGGGSPGHGCPMVRSDRVLDQGGVDSTPGNRGSVARPRRKWKKQSTSCAMTNYDDPK